MQGYGPEVGWADLAEAAYAVQSGAVWVATNVDATLPTARGMAPGNGTLVDAVRQATGKQPVVVGKPHTPLYDLSARVLGTCRRRRWRSATGWTLTSPEPVPLACRRCWCSPVCME